MECPPCGTEFHEEEIEMHIEEHHLEAKTACQICEEELDEGKMEEHISNHKNVVKQFIFLLFFTGLKMECMFDMSL